MKICKDTDGNVIKKEEREREKNACHQRLKILIPLGFPKIMKKIKKL